MSDCPIAQRPHIHFNQLDRDVTPGDALAAKDELAAIMAESGLDHVTSVCDVGGRFHVRVMTQEPILESHGLPETIGKVPVAYLQVKNLQPYKPSDFPSPAGLQL